MKCPKCKRSDIGFVAPISCLWFRGKDARVSFGRRKGNYQSVVFVCNSLACGQKIRVWCKLTVKPYKSGGVLK
jgi:hypothetical protein